MAWLSGWDKRVKLTIDQTDINAALENFPILVYISAASGRLDDDVSCVFDELLSDANRKKIAVTTSDGETQCYVEIEKWDDANEKAWLWVKVPAIAADVDTDLYLYYDSTHADNTTYVGDPNSTPAETVWNANFVFVSHLRDDPDNTKIRDSTGNNNDGAKKGAAEPAVTTSGKIDDAQSFDGSDDYIKVIDADSIEPSDITIEAWINPVSWNHVAAAVALMSKRTATSDGYFLFWFATTSTINFDWGGSGANRWNTGYNPPTGVWTHLAVTRAAAGRILYVNGAKNSNNGAGAGATSTSNLYIGINSLIITQYPYKGLMDEIRISNIARSAAWLKATYETGRDDLLDFGSEEGALGFTGTGAVAAQPAEIAAEGTLAFTGIGTVAVQPAAIAATGTALLAITGIGAVSAPPATIAGTGAQTFAGTGAVTAQPAAVAGTGTLAFTGTGAIGAQPASVAGAGGQTFTGTATVEAQPTAIEAIGEQAFSGTGTVAAQPAAVSATGAQTFAGAAMVAAQPAAIAGTGTVDTSAPPITGTAAIAVQPVAVAATGALAFTGTAAVAAQPAEIAATGTYTPLAITGTGSITVQPVAIAAAGTCTPLAITGIGTITAPLVRIVGTGTVLPGIVCVIPSLALIHRMRPEIGPSVESIASGEALYSMALDEEFLAEMVADARPLIDMLADARPMIDMLAEIILCPT